MSRREIKYIFRWPRRGEQTLAVVMDETNLEIILDDTQPPEWTRLEHHKCTHCPLDAEAHPHCPLAVSIVEPLRLCEYAQANDPLRVDVLFDDRLISVETTLQRAMSSLLGLIMPCSGCPHTQYLRPMARFHLPFATPQETLYRSTGMYLLGQYFRQQHGQEADFSLKGLQRIYRNLHTLNRDFAKRLRAGSEGDAAFNAVVFLDLFTVAMPKALKDAIKPIAPYFESYIDSPPLKKK